MAIYFGMPLLTACAATPPTLQARIAEKYGTLSDDYTNARIEFVDVDGWQLATVRRGEGVIRRIYIEGDGHAFISRDTPSGDPTPVTPVGLDLAMADKSAGVLYVARPCQWVRGKECKDRTLWTDKRFTQAVVDHYLELVRREAGAGPVELVGFSGGAWVALQVAARLPNVTRVTTVAGNLMPDWVNAQHHVTRIHVVAYPAFKRELPIVAYVGKGDTVVGRGVVAAFEAETGAKVEVREVEATHASGWVGVVHP